MTVAALDLAKTVLLTGGPLAKAKAARAMRKAWLEHGEIGGPQIDLPAQPARPERPILLPPNEVPRRRIGSPEGRAALLHAVAHIELNAIDLAADMLARFTHHPDIADEDRADFVTDWSQVCDDEARHFNLLSGRLKGLGMSYGDHPAHNGLWEAAQSTRHNFAARVAIAPLVLEARGLDVTPGMIKKLTQAGDLESVACLQVIYDEEISHVAIGAKWFQYLARSRKESPETWFHGLVREHFRGQVKSPFNEKARTLAGLSKAYYMPIAAKPVQFLQN